MFHGAQNFLCPLKLSFSKWIKPLTRSFRFKFLALPTLPIEHFQKLKRKKREAKQAKAIKWKHDFAVLTLMALNPTGGA